MHPLADLAFPMSPTKHALGCLVPTVILPAVDMDHSGGLINTPFGPPVLTKGRFSHLVVEDIPGAQMTMGHLSHFMVEAQTFFVQSF